MSPPPITAAQCPDEWIAAVREAADRAGWPMRAHAMMPAIEFKNANRNHWETKMLPGGGVCFTSKEERDFVMKRLEGA